MWVHCGALAHVSCMVATNTVHGFNIRSKLCLEGV
jgi:hypothetical protein